MSLQASQVTIVSQTERKHITRARCSIPVYKSEFVYGINSQSGFRDIKLRALLAQSVFFHEQRHHVTTGQKLHYEVKVYWILVKVKWMSFFSLLEGRPLCALYYYFFVQRHGRCAVAPKWSAARAQLIIHSQIRARGSYLKTVVHFNDPLVISFDKYIPLRTDVSHLFLFEHVRFA